MGSDSLKQVGKYIKGTRKDTDYALSQYSEIFPKIERIRAPFNPDNPFTMEFRNKQQENKITITLTFFTWPF
jgi:hypothetical protein